MNLATANHPMAERIRVRVHGAVQGVGFRPFVYRLATRHDLTGWVVNDGDGVLLEVEGVNLKAFLDALKTSPPPLARIDDFAVKSIPTTGACGFVIHSSQAGAVATGLPADAAVCDACLHELFDPTSRHYRYPFINCTHCGPRYTITRHLPYDRLQTSMSGFVMCADCRTEYETPLDRRFHAQPVACPACGPKLSMPIAEIVQRLIAGEILAIKGLGGFHLVCDGRNEDAVVRLRLRKNREEKPLAVMVANIASIETVAQADADELAQLSSPARPIVVLPKAISDALAPSIAPGLNCVGVMLPYTPLHYLLFHEAAGCPDGGEWLTQVQDLVLVMTSANPGGEPLVTDNAEAHRRLQGIADAIVTHDREIVVRADDSVMRFIGGAPTFIRRARGFVPQSIKLAHAVKPGLAVGAHMKATVCVTRGNEAFLSQHIGDLDTPQSLAFFEETVAHLLSITAVSPQWVAHDLHPDFFSTRFAQNFAQEHDIPVHAVQHHHAHIAAVIAEHGLAGPVLGLALDGFGLGTGDAQALNWGGEAMIVDRFDCRRAGHLAPLPLPGGEAAFRAPWRIAAAVLKQHGRENEIAARYSDFGDVQMLMQMLERNVNVVPSTSCGRLFDAAAGLLGVQSVASFDGQAPMKLEALVTDPCVLDNTWSLSDGVLDLHVLLGRLADMDSVPGANVFHGTLIQALADWAKTLADGAGLSQVVLSGGCLLNRVLAEGLERELRRMGFDVYRPRAAPPGDGAISLGQAYIASQKRM